MGAAASQNITDPTLGTRLLDRLARHGDASRALAEVTETTDDIAYRQLTVLGRSGPGSPTAVRTHWAHASATAEGAVAAGNMLCGEHIPGVLLDAYAAATGELEQRLATAMKAAVDAGGEEGRCTPRASRSSRTWTGASPTCAWTGPTSPSTGSPNSSTSGCRSATTTCAADSTRLRPSYGVPGDL
ncbi:DUF1028 domain-containing protein [Streptomyces sp. M19]